MPKDFRVHAAQAYIAHPAIQIGYKISRGGVGTVIAIPKAHPIDIAQASSSTIKRKRLDDQSSLIQFRLLEIMSVKEFYPQSGEWCSILRDRHFRHLACSCVQF